MDITNPWLVYLIAAGIAIIVGIIAVVITLTLRKNSSSLAYEDQLMDLLDYDGSEAESKPPTAMEKWNTYWGNLFKDMGWANYSEPSNSAGRDVIIVSLVFCAIISVVLKNPLVGILLTAGLVYVASVAMKNQAGKKAERINIQLPGFLFALKANVQANETPEKAILKVVDQMPSPLHEDLLIAKNRLMANSTFVESMEALGAKTTSRDLKFLCACMIQASYSGTNLENQITVIQKVLDDRRKVTAELDKAVRSVMPSIWVATLVIPGTFVASYFMDPGAKAFWFKDPLSWAALAVVILLYGVGVWVSRRFVDEIKNL